MNEKLRERVMNSMSNLIALGNCNLAYKEGINSVGHEAMERAISPALAVYDAEYNELLAERDRLSKAIDAKNFVYEKMKANGKITVDAAEMEEIERAFNG